MILHFYHFLHIAFSICSKPLPRGNSRILLVLVVLRTRLEELFSFLPKDS